MDFLYFIPLPPSSLPSNPSACEQSDDGDEEGRADDRPDDGEARPADVYVEKLGQLERAREPCADERADEAERNGDQAPAARKAADCLPQRTTQSRDEK
jgi:hypothetical protein